MPQRRPIIRRRRFKTEPPQSADAGASPPFLDLPLGDDAPSDDLGFDRGPGRAQAPPVHTPAVQAPPAPPRRPAAEAGADQMRPAGPVTGAVDFHHGYASPPPAQRGRRSKPPHRRRGGTMWPWLLLLLLLPLAVAAGYFLRPTPPVLTLSNDLLEFGEVRVGERSSARLAVRNDGESALELLTVEIVGDPDAAFERLEGTCGAPLGQGESCELALAFGPTEAGDARARLRLLTNAPVAAERSVPLVGRGTAPALEVLPSNLDFGEATVGERGGRGAVRLSNRGSASVRIDGVKLNGLAAADFVRRQDDCSGANLAAGQGCDVAFEFVPTKDGERRATVQVRAGAPIDGTPELRGRGLPQLPLLALEPARLDFARQRLGTSSEAVGVVLRNDGNGPLDIARVQVTGSQGGAPESFRLEDRGCAGGRLEPGASCRLRVGFEPRAEGQLGAVVEVEHSAAPGRHRLPVVGFGTAPRFALSPDQLSFGDMPKGRDSEWRHLEVRNTGSAALRVTAASVAGGDGRAFEISADGCLRSPIPPDQSCSIEVRFQARRDGPHRAEVRILHDAAGGQALVPVNGLGTSARLAVDPVALEFGAVILGTTRSLEFTLRNTGRAPLQLTRLDLQAPGLELERDCAGRTLDAGATCVGVVRATPQQAGPVRGRLVVETDAGAPREIAVSLEARPRPKPELVLDERRVEFSERYLGERSPIDTVTLRNRGGARLDLREMELEGDGAGDFQIVPGSCASFIAPGTACTVGVAFLPRTPGRRLAALAIRHSAEGGTARVLLEGVAVAQP